MCWARAVLGVCEMAQVRWTRKGGGKGLSGAALPIAFSLTFMCSARLANAEYMLGAGDVLEITVAGFSDLRNRTTVNPDGEINVPFVGLVRAEGLTLREVRQRVAQTLPERIFQRRPSDATSGTVMVQPDDISVSVAEYRPVYVAGDVPKPGEYPFRPGMTVRQAVVLAGDYDIFGGLGRLGPGERLTNGVEIETARRDLDRLEVRERRLRAQLEGSAFDISQRGAPQRLFVAEAETLEMKIMSQEKEEFDAEIKHLMGTLATTAGQLSTLEELRNQQREALRRQTSEVEKVRGFQERGVGTAGRVSEEQRTMLIYSDRLLQTEARISETENKSENLTWQLLRARFERKLKWLSLLQETQNKISNLRALLEVREPMFSSHDILDGRLSNAAASIRFSIARNRGKETVVPSEDTSVVPGDVITVIVERARPRTVVRGERH